MFRNSWFSCFERHTYNYLDNGGLNPAKIRNEDNAFGTDGVHPKHCNFNLHNISHSLISQNPRERMFVVQKSNLIVTFLSLISQILSLMKTTKEVNPHPLIAPCVNMWSVTFLFLFFFHFCHLSNVGACICHISREGQVEWTTITTPSEVRGE